MYGQGQWYCIRYLYYSTLDSPHRPSKSIDPAIASCCSCEIRNLSPQSRLRGGVTTFAELARLSRGSPGRILAFCTRTSLSATYLLPHWYNRTLCFDAVGKLVQLSRLFVSNQGTYSKQRTRVDRIVESRDGRLRLVVQW